MTESIQYQPVTTRSTRACLPCRTRKVRCDASHRGVPCTNCCLDGKECLVAERKSRRQIPCLDRTVLPLEDNQGTYAAVEATQPLETAQQQPNNPNTTPDSGSFEGINMDSSNTYIYSNIHSASRESMTKDTEIPRPITESHMCYQDFREYGFIKLGNMETLSSEDLHYLQTQRCFHLPSKLLLDELIRRYLFYVHPLLPILDDQSFWCSYFQPRQEGGVCKSQTPLLLLWCALFASSGFLSPASAASLGYGNVRNARTGFYKKAKILFDIGSESSPVILGQSALLLSFQTYSPRIKVAKIDSPSIRSNTIWLRTAIRHAQQANVETICCSPLVSTIASRKADSITLIRLWWCCILLDRIIALGQRRDLLIPKQYPLPSHTWFEDDVPWSKAQMTEIKQHFTVRLMHALKLCMVATDILLLESCPQQLKTKPLQQLKEAMVILEESGNSLKQWHDVAMLDIPGLDDSQNTLTSFQHPPLAAFTRVIRISYSAARLCAGHQELLLRISISATISATGDETLSAYSDLSGAAHGIQSAILDISNCIIEFMQLGLVPYLYIGIAAFAALPYLMQVLDLKITRRSCPEVELTDQYHRLCILTRAVKEYQARYNGLDHFGGTIQFISTNFQLITRYLPENVRITSWQDVLMHDPCCYMRLALALEHCSRTATIPTVEQLAEDLEGSLTIPPPQNLDSKQGDSPDDFMSLSS
ncbi:uncharacterized protein FPOAC1_014075 [Fusarium poae]|uniref:Zn(2)-C6 fungal-type domain-containing protein n=2 Tax=Fusarium poae TaxID=36050 RepID=A0A1B8AAB5_FUSPO|nr:uncharacterized protein FPOAC1_014075 [Fusarium poae]KAG8664106.1 hypothetical protein FPOAC1_014075 [Fusarium poae]OBS17405.1 hypothetical protein FPOA_12057 [Fusarium poae]